MGVIRPPYYVQQWRTTLADKDKLRVVINLVFTRTIDAYIIKLHHRDVGTIKARKIDLWPITRGPGPLFRRGRGSAAPCTPDITRCATLTFHAHSCARTRSFLTIFKVTRISRQGSNYRFYAVPYGRARHSLWWGSAAGV